MFGTTANTGKDDKQKPQSTATIIIDYCEESVSNVLFHEGGTMSPCEVVKGVGRGGGGG